jgi:hypothetical protein
MVRITVKIQVQGHISSTKQGQKLDPLSRMPGIICTNVGAAKTQQVLFKIENLDNKKWNELVLFITDGRMLEHDKLSSQILRNCI